jgi:hypothetical protein
LQIVSETRCRLGWGVTRPGSLLACTTSGLNHKLRTGFITMWIGEPPAGLAGLIGAAGKSALTGR